MICYNEWFCNQKFESLEHHNVTLHVSFVLTRPGLRVVTKTHLLLQIIVIFINLLTLLKCWKNEKDYRCFAIGLISVPLIVNVSNKG